MPVELTLYQAWVMRRKKDTAEYTLVFLETRGILKVLAKAECP